MSLEIRSDGTILENGKPTTKNLDQIESLIRSNETRDPDRHTVTRQHMTCCINARDALMAAEEIPTLTGVDREVLRAAYAVLARAHRALIAETTKPRSKVGALKSYPDLVVGSDS